MTIGNGAVIGAHSVVLNDVEPYSIVVGSPAKLLKKRFSDKMITILQQNPYYDLPQEQAKKLVNQLHKDYPLNV